MCCFFLNEVSGSSGTRRKRAALPGWGYLGMEEAASLSASVCSKCWSLGVSQREFDTEKGHFTMG